MRVSTPENIGRLARPMWFAALALLNRSNSTPPGRQAPPLSAHLCLRATARMHACTLSACSAATPPRRLLRARGWRMVCLCGAVFPSAIKIVVFHRWPFCGRALSAISARLHSVRCCNAQPRPVNAGPCHSFRSLPARSLAQNAIVQADPRCSAPCLRVSLPFLGPSALGARCSALILLSTLHSFLGRVGSLAVSRRRDGSATPIGDRASPYVRVFWVACLSGPARCMLNEKRSTPDARCEMRHHDACPPLSRGISREAQNMHEAQAFRGSVVVTWRSL